LIILNFDKPQYKPTPFWLFMQSVISFTCLCSI